MKNSASIVLLSLFASASLAAPTGNMRVRQESDCENRVINFDDAEFNELDPNGFTQVPDGFQGFNWPDFSITSCPGDACKSFPAETTQQFTGPRLAMAQGLVGGLLTGQLLLETTPSAEFNLANEEGSFDLGEFTIFDIIDLPEEVKAGAEEEMRVHLDCGKVGSDERVEKTIPFDRNADTAGYQVTADQVTEFKGVKGCKISTTQVFFPGKIFELEIPTESMGLDNLNVCVR